MNKIKIKYIIDILLIIVLCSSAIFLTIKTNIKTAKLNELTKKELTLQKQEQFVANHQKDLLTIKTLKQEILGQEKKLVEYTEQVNKFTETLIANEKKLEEME